MRRNRPLRREQVHFPLFLSHGVCFNSEGDYSVKKELTMQGDDAGSTQGNHFCIQRSTHFFCLSPLPLEHLFAPSGLK